MNATAANLIERVLPESGLRQWVLTFPFSWRHRLAQDGALRGESCLNDLRSFMMWGALASIQPATGFALAVLAWVSNIVMGLWSFPDEQHAVLSLIVVAFGAVSIGVAAGLRSAARHDKESTE